ncbi:MAG: cobalamin biosynthesis protein CobW, partial [Verrucomicrobia bacterium]|nr:cobalamin biosynthesis protein CobW [Verrucomicrobiota bacterium]
KPWGDRRQEIVVIGQSMDPDAIIAKFDGCLLTDDEMELGPEGWMTHFEDPFFDWQVAMEEEETTIQQ